MVEESDEEDEIIAEYPLYSSTTSALFKTESQDIRVVQLQYPLRPAWRSYHTENMSEVKYRPQHRLLNFKVPEDQPEKAPPRMIPLSGQGRVPEVPLCVMCKVDGCFVLIPINEVTQMRPDMSTFVASAYVKDEVPKEEEDVDYKPPAKPGAKASTGKASTSKGKAKAVKVEVKKRETDRQIQIRTRSYTHWREQLASEEACSLKPHGLTSGNITLTGAAKTIVQQYAGQVAMGVPRKEYLKYISPAVYLQRRQRKLPAPDAGAPGATGTPAAKEAAADAPPPLDDELCSALKQALEDLFADQAVVTMRDVRLWLQSYTANVKARTAALQTDNTLASLLLGGGSVVEIRGRYVLNTEDDPVRKEIVNLLKDKPEGVRKADVMAALRDADVSTTDHACSRALRTVCVAVGAVWHLKEGATFQKKI